MGEPENQRPGTLLVLKILARIERPEIIADLPFFDNGMRIERANRKERALLRLHVVIEREQTAGGSVAAQHQTDKTI